MLLFFLRHGEAGHNSATDFDRELTEEGVIASHNVGKTCRRLGIAFHAVLSSPLVRARQTARCVLEQLPSAEFHESEHLAPSADPRKLFKELQHYTRDSRVLLIGHEPFLSTTVSALISKSNDSKIAMKTTTLACIEIGPAVEPGAGTLRWLLTQEQCKLLAATSS